MRRSIRRRCRRPSPRSRSTCWAPSSSCCCCARTTRRAATSRWWAARRTIGGRRTRSTASTAARSTPAAIRSSTRRSPTACCAWAPPPTRRRSPRCRCGCRTRWSARWCCSSCSITSRSCAPRIAICWTCCRPMPPRRCSRRGCSPPRIASCVPWRAWSSWHEESDGPGGGSHMAISGSLKDVSVADGMQFIHLGRRTGTLLLTRGVLRAIIGFHGGRLVSAQAPRTPKLGDLLISSGLLDRAHLDQAVLTQSIERERRSLGQVLVGSGAIDAEGLRQVIAQQIEQAVSEVMLWDTGTFAFAIDDLRPMDDIALYPRDVRPDADLTTQLGLLEAAGSCDERSRGRGGPPRDGAPPFPVRAGKPSTPSLPSAPPLQSLQS